MDENPDSSAYRLDDLGWAQFERLSTELVELSEQVPGGEWQGRADGIRSALVPEGLNSPFEEGRLPGPSFIVAIWARPGQVRASRVKSVRRRLIEALGSDLGRDEGGERWLNSVLLLTNVDIEKGDLRLPLVLNDEANARELDITILGPQSISELVDGHPELRRRIPSLLGVRDGPLASEELIERSTADVEAAIALARVFVPTRAYARALEVLERHHFSVLTGPPEMGKTAIARMVGLALLAEGWEIHECVRPDELWARFSTERRQLFIADDAFGSTEYRPEAAERWALELDPALRAMDEIHWLIWTSRPAPLKAGLRRIHRERGVERFPQPAEIQVAASELDIEEKALILFRHAKEKRLPSDSILLVQGQGLRIVRDPHFTPERIRRFVSDRLASIAAHLASWSDGELGEAVAAEIREPTRAMASSLKALPPDYRALLIALLDAPPGPVSERDLAASVRRHAEGFHRPPSEVVDRLTDHFLRLVPPTSVTWVHPSWRDLVIEDLGANPGERRRFLLNCSIEGILLALSTGGGVAGERNFPLLLADEDWDAATDRLHELIGDLDEPSLHRFFNALEAALDGARDKRMRFEIQALATNVLVRLQRRWDNTHTAIPAALLGNWFAVASKLPEFEAAPALTATWIEFLPPSRIDIESDEELRRFDEWLRVAELLDEHSPEVLKRFRFPEHQADVISSFLEDATALMERGVKPRIEPLLSRCLTRLQVVAREHSWRAHELARTLRLISPAWLSEEVPSVPAPEPEPGDYIVARILSDLKSSG